MSLHKWKEKQKTEARDVHETSHPGITGFEDGGRRE